MISNPCFKAAIDYVGVHGLPAIPCKLWYEKPTDVRAQKKPLVNWREFQERLPTLDELSEWWTRWPDASVGIITGPLSGVFALDLDVGYDKEFVKSLNISKKTPISHTPSGGWHVFFKYPEGYDIKTGAAVAGKDSHIDIRANGGFIVVAPSTYPNGKPYEWRTTFEQFIPAEAPKSLQKALNIIEEKKRAEFRPLTYGTNQGSRNQSAAQIVGLFTRYLPERYWGPVIWPMLLNWNTCNTPPLPLDELEDVYNSIANKERFSKAKFWNEKKYEQRDGQLSEMQIRK